MAIPDYQTIMLPLLKLLGQRKEMQAREAAPLLTEHFRLTDEELRKLLPSGKQEVFVNRVGWARTFLKKAGLLETPRRGLWRITERGEGVLAKNPVKIDVKFLKQFPEFLDWGSSKDGKSTELVEANEGEIDTPEEILESAMERLRVNLQNDLLQQVKASSPEFFEILVIDLLHKMGYGGTRKDAAQAIGRSGDGGVDGIIKEDPLGLDVVYVQAKRWEGSVGRPEIQKFAGALQGYRARKGVFITTSSFSPDAKTFVENIDSKIVLIDGKELVRLMLEHNLGVSVVGSYEIKRIDQDYFTEE